MVVRRARGLGERAVAVLSRISFSASYLVSLPIIIQKNEKKLLVKVLQKTAPLFCFRKANQLMSVLMICMRYVLALRCLTGVRCEGHDSVSAAGQVFMYHTVSKLSSVERSVLEC